MEPSALFSYSFKPGMRAGAFALSPYSRSTHQLQRQKPVFFPLLPFPTGIRGRRFVALVPRAASDVLDGGPSRSGGGGRRVYRQSQAVRSLPSVSVKEIASFVVPAGAFLAVTFGMQSFYLPRPSFPSSFCPSCLNRLQKRGDRTQSSFLA